MKISLASKQIERWWNIKIWKVLRSFCSDWWTQKHLFVRFERDELQKFRNCIGNIKGILQDVNDFDNEAGFKLRKAIKSTMPDRASTEKKNSKFARGISNNNL